MRLPAPFSHRPEGYGTTVTTVAGVSYEAPPKSVRTATIDSAPIGVPGGGSHVIVYVHHRFVCVWDHRGKHDRCRGVGVNEGRCLPR